jgi:hypothetical protein
MAKHRFFKGPTSEPRVLPAAINPLVLTGLLGVGAAEFSGGDETRDLGDMAAFVALPFAVAAAATAGALAGAESLEARVRG